MTAAPAVAERGSAIPAPSSCLRRSTTFASAGVSTGGVSVFSRGAARSQIVFMEIFRATHMPAPRLSRQQMHAEVARRARAEQTHRVERFALDDRERAANARRSRGAQTVERSATRQDRTCAERDRLQQLGAASQ